MSSSRHVDPTPAASRIAAPSTELSHPEAIERAELVEPAEQATRAIIGIALLLTDATRAVSGRFVGTDPTRSDNGPTAVDDSRSPAVVARRIGIGVAFGAQRRLSAASRTAGRIGRPITTLVAGAPVVRPLLDRVGEALEVLYDEGAREETQARQVAARASSESVQLAVPVLLQAVDIEPILEAVLDRVDLERLLTRVLDKVEIDDLLTDLLSRVELDAILDKVLGQVDLNAVVHRVLADLDIGAVIGPVLDQIDLDPVVHQVLAELDLPVLVKQVISEVQLSSVMLDATGGITQDALTSVRSRSASADDLVERISARMFRRRAMHDLLTATDTDTPVPGDQAHDTGDTGDTGDTDGSTGDAAHPGAVP